MHSAIAATAAQPLGDGWRRSIRPDEVWTVDEGHVDLFVVAHGAGLERRQYLCRIGPGGTLLGVADDDFGLFAVPHDDARIRATTRAELATRLAPTDTDPTGTDALTSWIDAVGRALPGGPTPKSCEPRGAGDVVEIDGDAAIQPREPGLWIELTAGSAMVSGRAALPEAPGVVPFPPSTWVSLGAGARATVRAGRELAAASRANALLAGSDVFAAAVIRAVLASVRADETSQSALKAEADRRALASAFVEVASAFDERVQVTPSRGRSDAMSQHDALVAACRALAGVLHVPIVVPNVGPSVTQRERFELVARSSNLRIRRVRLTAGWWTADQGPLLALTKSGRLPVALLPRGTSAYVLVDPITQQHRAVDAGVAETLEPAAWTFYRPFRSDIVGVRDIVAVGLHNCGRDLLAILLLGSAGGFLAMALPLGTAVLINSIIPGAERGRLVEWTILMLVAAAAGTLLQVARSIAAIRVEMKMGCALQAAVWSRLTSLPLRFFREYSAGALTVRAMGIDAIRQALSGSTVRSLLGGLFSLLNLGLLFYYSASLALAALGLIVAFVAIVVGTAYYQLSRQREISLGKARVSGLMLQLLGGISKLRVAGAEARAFGVWAKPFSDQRRQLFKARVAGNGFSMVNAVFPVLSSIVLFAVALGPPPAARLRTGDFLAFIAAFSSCVTSAVAMAGAFLAVVAVMPSYEMARPILETAAESSGASGDAGTLTGDINVVKLRFGYSADAPPILHDVSFHIKPGEFVAFAGPSGSGKSTILRLLLGFEQPQSGAIFYDGLDLRGLDVHAVRKQIGVVLQAGRLMPGDLYTNIVGCSSATLEQAWEAAHLAGMADDIKRMPMGMHTVVTEGGGTLSGGQRQRLMIARAIVNRPRILLLDEATSALDNTTQSIVTESLRRLQATRVVVAHRLTTIVDADRIFVVERGVITQTGTYDELIRQPGLFADLAMRQVM